MAGSTERTWLARTCTYAIVRHCSPPHRELTVIHQEDGKLGTAIVATDSYEFYAGELSPNDTSVKPFLYAINCYTYEGEAREWARRLAHGIEGANA